MNPPVFSSFKLRVAIADSVFEIDSEGSEGGIVDGDLLTAVEALVGAFLDHLSDDAAGSSVHVKLDAILAQGVQTMSKLDELNAELVEINDTTNTMAAKIDEIASDIDDLVAKLAAGGLTAEEADAVKAQLVTLKGQLSSLSSGLTDVAAKHTP